MRMRAYLDEETDPRAAEAVEVVEIGGYKAYIVPNEDERAPGEDDEGRMAYVAHWDRHYNIGGFDTQRIDPDEWLSEAKAGRYITIQVSMYEHGGRLLYEGHRPYYQGGWDSRFIGWVYTTPARVRELYCVKSLNGPIKARVLKELRGYIEALNQWMNGEVYCYDIVDAAGEDVDSCCGLYGLDYATSEVTAIMEGLAPSVPSTEISV